MCNVFYSMFQSSGGDVFVSPVHASPAAENVGREGSQVGPSRAAQEI